MPKRSLYGTSKYFIIVIVSFFLNPFLYNQAPYVPESTPLANQMAISLSAQYGTIIVNHTPYFITPNENGNIFKETSAFTIDLGWKMMGGQEWHHTCKYPRMGIGIQYMRILNRNELGHPFSIYGFYDGNYYWSKNFKITNRMAAGLAYGFLKYNPQTAYPNDVIGTHINAFTELGIGFSVRLKDMVFIEPGFRFNHFSNGNIKKPQRGINIASYKIGIQATMGNQPEKPLNKPISKCRHRHELLAFIGASPRQIEFKINGNYDQHETYGINYLMANLHLGYQYEANHRIKVGGGVDLVYDGTNGQAEAATSGKPPKNAVPFNDKVGLAVFVGGETVVDKLSFVGNLCYMVAQSRFNSSTPLLEQRLGFKYHFNRNIFAGINIRAYNFKAAKAIEFNIGARKIFEGK